MQHITAAITATPVNGIETATVYINGRNIGELRFLDGSTDLVMGLFADRPNPDRCPLILQVGIMNYVNEGGEPGDFFLQAILENDLATALMLANAENIHLLRHIMAFVNEFVPHRLMGSPHKVTEHIAAKVKARTDFDLGGNLDANA